MYQVTSSVDILPTIAKITGNRIPDWCEGEILPTFRPTPDDLDRHVFAVEAKSNAKNGALSRATVGLVGARHKLTHYFGYPGFEDVYEMYDLEEDPEELVNIYSPSDSVSRDLKDQILARIERQNAALR